MEPALRGFIVSRPLRGLTADISYQKSTGSIVGWYYHKNSEQYPPGKGIY